MADHRQLIAAAKQQAKHFHERTQAAVDIDQRARAASLIHGIATTPQSIPGYPIVEEIHRGGQGVVYRAIQQSTGRDVAVKVLLAGAFAGPNEKGRFTREVQILAKLKHPNIVTIHDSGETDDGAYFVMDYIDGLPFDEYITQQQPRFVERLRLFAKVCNAVNVAHLRGVLHRDLKPGNIRVDPSGEPHVLDFGLARHATMEPGDAGTPEVTATGQFVGTLAWASPEQVRGLGDEVDLRTDVYSLGVLLFQILTGGFPYEVNGPLSQTVENILHQDPVAPSSLNRELDDEIVTIVRKALRKDREGRYETAGDLGRDVERYLRGEPIAAKRSSTGYLLRKQLSKHKVSVGVVVAFVVMVTVGFAVSLALWRESVIARMAEFDQKKAAIASAELADQRAIEAASEARRANATTEFLVDMLASADPIRGERADMTVREVADAAADRLSRSEENDNPEFAAAVHAAIGRTYNGIGLYDQAREQLVAARDLFGESRGQQDDRVLNTRLYLADLDRKHGSLDRATNTFKDVLETASKADNPNVEIIAQCLNALGNIHRDAGELKEAREFGERAVQLLRESSSAANEQLASTLNDWSLTLSALNEISAARFAIEESIEHYRMAYGDEHYLTASAQMNFAAILAKSNELERAESAYESVLTTFRKVAGPEHTSVASALDGLGRLHQKRGRFTDAKHCFQQVVDIRRMALGETHALVAYAINNLAMANYSLGDLDAAAAGFENSLKILKAKRGEHHPSLASLINNIAAIHRARGKLAESAAALRESLAIREKQYGPDHPAVAQSHQNLARILTDLQELDDAEIHIRESIRVRANSELNNDVELANATNILAVILLKKGDHQLAIDACHEAESLAQNAGERGESLLVETFLVLGQVDLARENFESAETSLGKALDLAARHLPADHWQTSTIKVNHATALARLDRFQEAESEILVAYDRLVEKLGHESPQTVFAKEQIVLLYTLWERPDRVEHWQSQNQSKRQTNVHSD